MFNMVSGQFSLKVPDEEENAFKTHVLFKGLTPLLCFPNGGRGGCILADVFSGYKRRKLNEKALGHRFYPL